MSSGGMVTPSFLIKRKPCVAAALSTFCATAGEGLDMSISGISAFCSTEVMVSIYCTGRLSEIDVEESADKKSADGGGGLDCRPMKAQLLCAVSLRMSCSHWNSWICLVVVVEY
jgi:hypothetical protein